MNPIKIILIIALWALTALWGYKYFESRDNNTNNQEEIKKNRKEFFRMLSTAIIYTLIKLFKLLS